MLSIDVVDILQAALQAASEGLHVSLPGTVLRFDASKEACDVKISVRKRRHADEDEGEEAGFVDFPILKNIKFKFPRTKHFALTFPVSPGDCVAVTFADVNLSEWRAAATGDAESPDYEVHGIAGAYAEIGLWPDAEAWPSPRTDAVEMRHKTGAAKLAVTETHVEIGAGGAALPTLASVDAKIAAVAAYAATAPGIGPAPVFPALAGTTVLVAK